MESLVFSTNGTETTEYPQAKMNLDAYLILSIKIHSKGIIDPDIRAKAIKLLEENIEVNLCHPGLDKVDFSSRVLMANGFPRVCAFLPVGSSYGAGGVVYQ